MRGHGGPVKSSSKDVVGNVNVAPCSANPSAPTLVQRPARAHPRAPGDDNAGMKPEPTAVAAPMREAEIDALQRQLDAVPPPLEPLDVSALDGYLCGVLLQPRTVPPDVWLPGVFDLDGRPLPPGFDAARLQALVLRRHAELDRAIGRRDWFDPWIFQLDEADSPSEAVLPWVAGFAAAQDRCPALLAIDDAALVEPLALLYLHFDREDLEDADALLEVIDTLEPPADLAEAVQDLVRALMLIADVTRPRPKAATAAPRRPGGARRPGGGRRR